MIVITYDYLNTDKGKNGTFYVEVNGKHLAEVTCGWACFAMFMIGHKQVCDKLTDKQLTTIVTAFARKRLEKAKAFCPFANWLNPMSQKSTASINQSSCR